MRFTKKAKSLLTIALVGTTTCALSTISLTSCGNQSKEDEKCIKVNFDAGEGFIKKGSATVKLDLNTKTEFGSIQKPEVEAVGKIFAGWTFEKDGQTVDCLDSEVISKSINLRAKYVNNVSGLYKTISFHPVEGSVIYGNNVVAVKEGHPLFTINKPIAYKENYLFGSWGTRSGQGTPEDPYIYAPVNEAAPIVEDMDLYPLFVSYPTLLDKIYSISDEGKVIIWNTSTLCSQSDNIVGYDFQTLRQVVNVERANFNGYKIEFGKNVTTIDDNFLYGCSSFNSEVVIHDNITSIGYGFLCGCSSFNQDLTIGSQVESIGNMFMAECSSFTSTLTVNANVDAFGDNEILYGTTDADPIYVTGYELAGTNANQFWNKFPDQNAGRFRRRKQKTFNTVSVTGSFAEGTTTDTYSFAVTSGSVSSWDSSYDLSLNITHTGTEIASGAITATVKSITDSTGQSLVDQGIIQTVFQFDAASHTFTIDLSSSITQVHGDLTIVLDLVWEA